MNILEMLMNTGKMLDESEIASDMLKDSKFAVISLGKAIGEITNAQLREIMISHLLTAIAQHHQLSDLGSDKEWYQPFLPPASQMPVDFKKADQLNVQ